ncbi:MAG: DJ-1/PfpI family protein, partial [Terriglobales bacterium]
GFINPDMLRQSREAREFVRAFDRAGKPIASLCHGPWVLESAGLVEDRVLTSWPGVRDDMVSAGATWLDEQLVQDGNLITSRGPQDMVPFVRGIIKHFAKGASMRKHARVAQSSPQRNEPPKVVIEAMRWLPRPSIRGAVIGGAVVAGLLAYRNRGGFRKLQTQISSPAA